MPISDRQANRWSCSDAEVRRLVVDPAGIVTEYGRAQLILPRGLRLQVALRDGRCRFPGCRLPAMRGQVHHLVHWADGGTMDLANLAVICAHHHRFLHEGHIDVTGDPGGTLVFMRGRIPLGATRPQPVSRSPG